MRIALLTVSDAGARGERADRSGDAVAEWIASMNALLVARALVPDDTVAIVRQLLAWCDGEDVDLVLTTGGTGLAPRDVTPEATRIIIERDASGIAEWVRSDTGRHFPRAVLGRGVAGVRGETLILNLPGSTSGVRECLASFEAIAHHAIAILKNEPTEHSGPAHSAGTPTP